MFYGFVSQRGWGCQRQELLVRWLKTRASLPAIVYRKVEQAPSPAADFELPNGCALAADNRWVIMVELIPYRFRVLEPDPHGFDRDNDGIGCEK